MACVVKNGSPRMILRSPMVMVSGAAVVAGVAEVARMAGVVAVVAVVVRSTSNPISVKLMPR